MKIMILVWGASERGKSQSIKMLALKIPFSSFIRPWHNDDYDSYVKERDFYYPYMENVAGRIVNSFDQLCDCLSSGDYTMDPDKRDMIVAKFWGETAGYDSSQKILDFIRQSSQK